MTRATPVADRRALYATAFVRATTTGLSGLILGVHLSRATLGPAEIGLVVSAGLSGCALAAIVVTFAGDRLGRRRTLVALALLGALGTAALVGLQGPALLAVAAFVGMVNGMGKDRGAALILEGAALPATTDDAGRTRVIAVYTMLQDVGHALGAGLAGLPALLARVGRVADAGGPPGALSHAGAAMQDLGLPLCALAGLLSAVLYERLGPAVEGPRCALGLGGLSPRSRGILARICALFALDGLGGGFLTAALVSWFFTERFAVDLDAVAPLFVLARLMNAGSHLGAAWLARRIGLVNTMVFTHVPSSLLLVTVAFAPSFPVAAVLFLLREGLVEMDVPTRQSYVLAVVAPEERTLASGLTTLVRLLAWAVGPALAGGLMRDGALFLPLVVGASMKITYDVLLWRAFRSVRPPEES